MSNSYTTHSSLSFGQAALTFCSPRATSCLSQLMILLEGDLPVPLRIGHCKVTCPARKSTCSGLLDRSFSSPDKMPYQHSPQYPNVGLPSVSLLPHDIKLKGLEALTNPHSLDLRKPKILRCLSKEQARIQSLRSLNIINFYTYPQHDPCPSERQPFSNHPVFLAGELPVFQTTT